MDNAGDMPRWAKRQRRARPHAIIERIARGQVDVDTLRVYERALDIAAVFAKRGDCSHINVLVFDERDECVGRWRWRAPA